MNKTTHSVCLKDQRVYVCQHTAPPRWRIHIQAASVEGARRKCWEQFGGSRNEWEARPLEPSSNNAKGGDDATS